MSLDSFLGKTAAALPEGGFVRGGGKASVPESHTDPSSVTTTPPSESAIVSRDVTPNGTVIEYEAQPKRLYRIGSYDPNHPFDAQEPPEMYEVPSVTTVLGILNKPQLVWWGMQKGVQGVIDLIEMGVLNSAFDWEADKERLAAGEGFVDEPAITNLLKEHKLTVNHRLDQASERGVNVHDALESWARVGMVPDVSLYPETEQGYVEGLINFLEDLLHDATPEHVEVMVGSVEHGFAGRFDLVLNVSSPFEYAARCFPKRADKVEVIEPGRYLVDLKTSKGVYTSHHLQLAAYELAAVECGYPATDGQAILHVTADGKYELIFSDATPEQFLAIRKAYAALEELK